MRHAKPLRPIVLAAFLGILPGAAALAAAQPKPPAPGLSLALAIHGVLGRAPGEADTAELWENPRDHEAPRVAVLKNPDGTVLFAWRDLVPCRACGGVRGDPLESLAFERGSLVARLQGGSRERWNNVVRLGRDKSGRLSVLGWERSVVDTLTGEGWSQSVNAITGEVASAHDDPGGRLGAPAPACELPAKERLPSVAQAASSRERWLCGFGPP